MSWKDNLPKENIYYKEESGILYCADCVKLLKKFPDDTIDLVITSPPYNLGIKYDTKFNVGEMDGEEICDYMDWDDYYNWCSRWLKEIYRILKPDGRFCLNHYFSCGGGRRKIRVSPLMDLNWIATREIGFKHHGVAFWLDRTLKKRTAWGSWLNPRSLYINSPLEGILILYKEKWEKEREGVTTITKEDFMMGCSGLWEMQPENRKLNPAPFPEKLPELCVNLFSFKEDIVLDPFLGSGTTAVVCKKLERRWVGVEISENYCRIAKERIGQINELPF